MTRRPVFGVLSPSDITFQSSQHDVLLEGCPHGSLSLAMENDVWQGPLLGGIPGLERCRTRTVMVLVAVDCAANASTVSTAWHWLEDRPVSHGSSSLFRLLQPLLQGEPQNASVRPIHANQTKKKTNEGSSLLSSSSLQFFSDDGLL